MRSPAHDRVSVPMAQFLLLGLLAILSRYRCLGFHEETRYPCAFIDTANITDIPGSVGDNATYFYNWTPIPHHLVAVYDFVIDNGIRIPARKHLRACVCRLKPCVRICCPSGHLYDADTRRCSLPRRGLPLCLPTATWKWSSSTAASGGWSWAQLSVFISTLRAST